MTGFYSKSVRRAAGAALLACAAAGGAAQAGIVAVTVLDKDGKPVPDAVVVVVPANRGTATSSAPPPTAATVSQARMQFVPYVTIAAPGARLTFVNNDPWEHHVRGTAAGAAQFNATSDEGGFEMRLDAKPDGKPGRSGDIIAGPQAGPVLLGCHIHVSMRGYVYLSDSPWTAKSGADGVVQFNDVPDGPAQIRVWQADQLIDLPPQAVKVGGTEVRTTAQLQVAPRRRRATSISMPM